MTDPSDEPRDRAHDPARRGGIDRREEHERLFFDGNDEFDVKLLTSLFVLLERPSAASSEAEQSNSGDDE